MSDVEVIDSDCDDSKDESLLGDKKVEVKSKVLTNSDKLQYDTKFKIPLKKKRKNQYNPVEEARLERLVFDDTRDILNNLASNEESVYKFSRARKSKVLSDVSQIKTENTDDETSITIDHFDTLEAANIDFGDSDEKFQDERKPAWTDEDDAEYTVDAALSIQGRRLPKGRPEKMYSELLQNKYKQLVGTPKWADINKIKESASDDSDDEILKHSCHVVTPKVKNLVKGTIQIKVLTSINKQTQTEGPLIMSLQFHPTSTVALVAGVSGILSIFQIDGRENNKLHSMQFERFPIDTAKFTREGSEIVVGSRRHAHCHVYDLITGKTHRIPLSHDITNMKKFEVSPDGKLLALCGRKGEIHLLTSKTKELVKTLKMNEKCNALAFTPDNRKLFTHGDGGEMYIWDVNSRMCIHRAYDEGCLSGSTIAVSPSGQFLATGSKQGVVNIYSVDTVLQQNNPTPVKAILNLVTPITSLSFNPTSEILAMASHEKENAFRMVHLPSATVFSNFPTFQTKLFNPWSLAFSPNSGYLGIGNNKSNAFLCRLKHYENY